MASASPLGMTFTELKSFSISRPRMASASPLGMTSDAGWGNDSLPPSRNLHRNGLDIPHFLKFI